jgi:hypothetical protein
VEDFAGANYNGVDNGTGGGQTLYRFYVRFSESQNGAKMILRPFRSINPDGRDMCDMKWIGAYISYSPYINDIKDILWYVRSTEYETTRRR